MPRSVEILGTAQLGQLSRRLRSAGGPRLQRNLARRVRRAAEPLHRDLQKAIVSVRLSSTGRKSRGGPSPTTRPLRKNIAGAVRISVRQAGRASARVWLDRSRLPADITMGVVARIDEGRLRHPVFGNRKRWVTQTARPAGWWSHTVQTGTPRMQAEVERVLRDVRRDLD